MAKTDFFRINMPYGIVKNSKGEWMSFNRDYKPLGWYSTYTKEHYEGDDSYNDIPVRTKYLNATEEFLRELIDKDAQPSYDKDGRLNKIFLYSDDTNPADNEGYWNTYMEKIKYLSKLEV